MSKHVGMSTGMKPQASILQNKDASESSAKGALEALITSARILASDPTVDSVLERFSKIKDLETDIRSKDERVETLLADMKKMVANHDTTHRKALSNYDASRDRLKLQVESSEEHVVSLQNELKEKVAAIAALRDNEVSMTDKIEGLSMSAKLQDEEAKKTGVKIRALEESLEMGKAANEQLKKAHQQQGHELARSKAALARLQDDYEKLSKEHRSIAQQWQVAQSLTVSLHEQDLESMTMRLESVWSAALKLVYTTFFLDLPDAVMQNEAVWSRLKRPRHWAHSLPIPQSNSDAAKQMRSVVILASLAHTIDFHIFQPTYFLPPNSGIRNLLTRQAQDESRKESAIRAMAQALLPRDQDTVASGRVIQACDELIQDFGALLPPEGATKFRENLKEIVEDARDVWRNILRSRDAVEPSFALQYYRDWIWHEMRFENGRAVVRDHTQDANADRDIPLFAIFPRMCISEEGGQDPVTHGVLFTRSQTLAAREETEQQPSSPGLGRGHSVLTRRLRPRQPSASARSKTDEPEPQSFLDRRSGDQSLDGPKSG